jgi:prepilin-type N-terminal cleavage/methylation domain-containing protein
MIRRYGRRGGARGLGRRRARSGFSLVEVLVALVVLSIGMIGVATMGSITTRQYSRARDDLGLWAAMQTVGDSLQQQGFGAVSGNTVAVNTYNFSWSVDTSTTNLHKVTLAGWSTAPRGVADTVVIFLARPYAP